MKVFVIFHLCNVLLASGYQWKRHVYNTRNGFADDNQHFPVSVPHHRYVRKYDDHNLANKIRRNALLVAPIDHNTIYNKNRRYTLDQDQYKKMAEEVYEKIKNDPKTQSSYVHDSNPDKNNQSNYYEDNNIGETMPNTGSSHEKIAIDYPVDSASDDLYLQNLKDGETDQNNDLSNSNFNEVHKNDYDIESDIKSDAKKDLKENESPSYIQSVQYDGGDPELDKLIAEALKNNSNSSSVIIINQIPSNYAKGSNDDENQSNGQLGLYGIENNIEENKASSNYMKYEDIGLLLKLIENISDILEGSFKNLPTDDTEGASTLKQVANIVAFYKKINTFISQITEHEKQLKEEINDFHDKIEEIKTEFDDVLIFYEVKESYNKVKLLAENYKDLDEKYVEHFRGIDDSALKFAADHEDIIVAISDLSNLCEDFVDRIEELKKIISKNTLNSLLNQFNIVSLRLINVIEMRFSIQAAIKRITDRLLNMKSYKELIDKKIGDIGKLNEYYSIKSQETPSIGNGSYIRSVIILFLMIPIALFV